VLVVGEAIVDLLPPVLQPGSGSMQLTARFGGSPANAAVGLARLGVPVGFAGRLARRGYGPWLRTHLEAEQVDLGPSIDADESCTLAVVTLDDAGVASYEFYGPDTADWAWRAGELPDPAGLAGSTVHTGSLATGLAPGAVVITEWLRRLRRNGDVAISYDPNIRPSLLGDVDLVSEVLLPPVACAHLVKVSEEDLGVLYPGIPLGEVATGWLAGGGLEPGRDTAAGPELVVVTVGGDGAVAWHRDGRKIKRSHPPVDVVDTVGAGDAFTAGLLSCLYEQGTLSPGGLAAIATADIEAAMDRANRVAAITCTRSGADPPRLDELT
jgi:fructokinase